MSGYCGETNEPRGPQPASVRNNYYREQEMIENDGRDVEPVRARETPILDNMLDQLRKAYEKARDDERDAERSMNIARDRYDDCSFQRSNIEAAMSALDPNVRKASSFAEMVGVPNDPVRY